MSIPESKAGFEEYPPEYSDLLQQCMLDFGIVLNGIKDNAVHNVNPRFNAEFIQPDDSKIVDQTLISLLLTSTGGNAVQGLEKIKLFAWPRYPEKTINEMAQEIPDELHFEESEMPFRTDEFFIEHMTEDGEVRHCRIDKTGIHAWRPYLKDLTHEVQELAFSEFDLLTMEPGKNPSAVHEGEIDRLNLAYAKELIAKLDDFLFVPQNTATQ